MKMSPTMFWLMLKRIAHIVALVVAVLFTGTADAQLNKYYYYYTANRLNAQGEYRDAIGVINVLLRNSPQAYDGYFLRGISKYNLNDFAGAEQDFSTAIELNPVYVNAIVYRAITHMRQGDYKEALDDFTDALDIRPDNMYIYYSRGMTLFLNQQFEEAIADLDRFLTRKPKEVDGYIGKGSCLLMLKDTTAAFDNYDKAVSVNRYDPNGYIRRGSIYMMRKDYDNATADFSEAIKLDPHNFQAYFSRAVAYANDNNPLGAIADFGKAIEIDSLSSLAYFNRAIVYSQIGDYEKSLADYNRVAEYSPQNVLVYVNRAAVNSRIGLLKEAEADYTKAIDLFPDFANAYRYRSQVRYAMGDMRGSREDHDMAERKIAAYKDKSSAIGQLSDTSKMFTRLLSFDADFGNKEFDNVKSRNVEVVTMPMFRVIVENGGSGSAATSIKGYRHSGMESEFASNLLIGEAMTNTPVMMKEDDIASLVKRFESLVATERSARALYAEGVARYMSKQYSDAVRSFKAAIKLDPYNPYYYMSCSVAVAEMTDFISSVSNSHKLILNATPAEQLNMPQQQQSYSYDEPIELMTQAISLDPTNAYFYYDRACIHCKNQDYTEAVADFDKAIELYPYFAEAYYSRGMVLLSLKDTDKGLLDMSKAGELGIDEAYEMINRMRYRYGVE